MRPRDIKTLLRKGLDCGSTPEEELGSIFIEGSPGVGKSQTVAEVVKEYQESNGPDSAGLIDMRLTLCDPTDLRGIPFPNLDDGNAVWLSPEELPTAKSPQKGILFFDDLTTAAPAVQAAAYQLVIQPHQLGSYKLPEGWIVVGAGNKTSDKSLANKMPMALANRFTHVTYDYNVEDWVNWAAGIGHIDPVILGFMQSPAAETSDPNNPHLLYNFDPNRADKAFATPRSWERVSRIMSKSLPKNVERSAVEGTIGESASSNFFAFINLFDKLPDPDEILEKGNFDVSFESVDMKYAMVVAVANRVKPKKQHINNAFNWINALGEYEYGALLTRILANTTNQDLLVLILESDAWSTYLQDSDLLTVKGL